VLVASIKTDLIAKQAGTDSYPDCCNLILIHISSLKFG
jgi:hypothetical protein